MSAHAAPDAVVTDVRSVKGLWCASWAVDHGKTIIGRAHPVAVKETTGRARLTRAVRDRGYTHAVG